MAEGARLESVYTVFRIEGSNPSFSVDFFIIRPLGQAVKTPPFHGGNTGSNPVGVMRIIRYGRCSSVGRATD